MLMTQQLKRYVPSKPTVALFIKAFTFGLLLLFVETQDFKTLPVLIFLFFALLFYFQPIFKTFSLLTSLIALVTLSLLVTSEFAIAFKHAGFESTIPVGMVIFAAAFSVLFYLLIGVKNLLFLRRRQCYYVLHFVLLYLGFGLFFSADTSTSFLMKSLYLFIFSALMLREFFKFQEHTGKKLTRLSVFVIAFMITQFAWALSLLPILFSSAAGILTVSAYMASEFTSRHLNGTLDARFIRRSFVLFISLMLVIFLSSTWTL